MDEFTLKLEWAYGYRGSQCRNNLFYNKNGDLVYFLAGLGIVHIVKNGEQKFYFEHNDDILCLSLDPTSTYVATGQIGEEPYICIWNSSTLKTISILKDLNHTNGVGIVSFSPDAQLLLSVGIDDKSTIIVWDLKKAKPVARTTENYEKVFDGQFHSSWPDTVVTCGLQHIKFWRVCGNVLNTISENTAEVQTVLCLAFGPNAVTFAGGLNGSVFLFQKEQLSGTLDVGHQGGVFCMCQTHDGFITGSRSGDVKLWDAKFKPVSTISLSSLLKKNTWVRAVCNQSDKVLIGTSDSEIYEILLRDREKPKLLVSGHADKELWALAVHPKKPMFATGSDDQTIRIWDSNKHCLLELTETSKWIRSLAYSNDGSFLAAGLADGTVIIYKSRDFVELTKTKDRKRPIHELKFSPNGEYLATCCNDGCVDLYIVNQKFKHQGTCQSTTNNITHLDWSEDCKVIQVNTGSSERFMYKIPSCKPYVSGKDEPKVVKWATWTCVVGAEVEGLKQKGVKPNQINTVDVNPEKKILASGTHDGLVKLFAFPVHQKQAKCQKFVGHSADVTSVRWAADGETLITLGGADHAILQWRLIQKSKANQGENKLSKRESDSENDSESVKSAEIDSDVERATNTSKYKRFVTKERAKKFTRKIIRTEMKKEGKKRTEPPAASLELHYAFGYRGYDCFNNIYFSQHGEIIYHIAAVAVIMNRESGVQKFYVGHTDDILCMSIHPQKDIIASGQIGKVPVIHVWDVQTLKAISILKGQHTVGISSVDFSGDGKRLVSVGVDDNHCIVIWDWKKGEKLALARGHKDKIFSVCFNPKDPLKLATVGVRHIKFWTHAGSGFTSVRGVFGNVAKMETMLSIVYSNTADDTCFSGASDGTIYVWTATKLIRVVAAHKGPCFALFALEKGFITGGKDGVVTLWDEKFENLIKKYPVQSKLLAKDSQPLLTDNPVITAATLGHNKIIAGTKHGEIIEADKAGNIIVLMQGHCEGEVWGLCVHPTEMIIGTVSDDCYLRLWSFTDASKRLLSTFNLSKPARCVAINADGKSIAVGFKDGSVSVLKADTFQQMYNINHRKEAISDIKFSPDGKYLAVGSHDNFVDIYDVISGKRKGICKGSSSYITHLDWDVAGAVIRSNSGAREELFFQAPSGTREPLSPDDSDQYKWATWTSVLGPYCSGIWPPNSDVTDINASCLHSKYPLLVTGDDLGFVKLFHFPVSGKYAKYKDYLGHSAHVTNCRFSNVGDYLVTIGGADTALFIWKLTADKGLGQSATSDTDSEEEGEFDSEVEWEKNFDYKSKTYTKTQIKERDITNPTEFEHNPVKCPVNRELMKKINVIRADPSTFAKNKKKKQVSQIGEIKLEYIFGYRGFDCANNLFYINDGSEILYHAAGAGIVMNLASGQQKFYLEHSDDIISLAVNLNPKYDSVVATSQIDVSSPTIRVWDYKTMKTLSILKCNFSNGAHCLEFSPGGKHLMAVGIDDQHTITIWKWQDGSLAATGPGYTNRIFDAKFRPDSDQNFVTVGVKHLKFWQICGSEIVGKKGVLKTNETPKLTTMSTMLSIAFAPENVTYTGCISGDIYIWKNENLLKIVTGAHTGPVFCLYTTLSDGLIVSGAKEKKSVANPTCVKLWDQQLQRCKPFSIQPMGENKSDMVKSLCRHKNKIIVGTKNCDIIEIQEQTAVPHFVLRGHSVGNLEGLSVSPTQNVVATASCDRTLRLWDLNKKVMLSMTSFDNEAFCCQFNPDGGLLAVGLKNGELVIMHSADLTIWARKRERGSSITELKFSPDGKFLAVGFLEPAIEIYDISQGPQLQKISYLKAMQCSVKHMDFSADGTYLKVANVKLQTFIFQLPEGQLVSDNQKIDGIVWATWTSVCGKEVRGIWPENWKETEINNADLARVCNVLAVGDDSGFVKLFPFPCSEKTPFMKCIGHSAHVANVRFTYDDSYLVSVGGDDSCVFVWKCLESNTLQS